MAQWLSFGFGSRRPRFKSAWRTSGRAVLVSYPWGRGCGALVVFRFRVAPSQVQIRELRRQTYNLSFDPDVTNEIRTLALPNYPQVSLRSYFPFEEGGDGRPTHVQHKASLRGDAFISWSPTIPNLYARIYSKYGLQNPDWERYSLPHDANAVWHYLPHHAQRRARREDDLENIRDIDHGEISPRDYRDSF